MPKRNIAASTAGIAELIAVKSIHSISVVLALLPVPFIIYYAMVLDLDMDWQSLFSAISLTAALCILIYISVRCAAWLLYAVVIPGAAWLLYVTVHGLAWLVRTIIVPAAAWLLTVALPVVAWLLYAALRGLARRIRTIGGRLGVRLGPGIPAALSQARTFVADRRMAPILRKVAPGASAASRSPRG
ncbi:MAG: hypothetical protein AB7H90_03190 [Alphaproteobacteria bacterium]